MYSFETPSPCAPCPHHELYGESIAIVLFYGTAVLSTNQEPNGQSAAGATDIRSFLSLLKAGRAGASACLAAANCAAITTCMKGTTWARWIMTSSSRSMRSAWHTSGETPLSVSCSVQAKCSPLLLVVLLRITVCCTCCLCKFGRKGRVCTPFPAPLYPFAIRRCTHMFFLPFPHRQQYWLM